MSQAARVLIVDPTSKFLARHGGLLRDPKAGVVAESVATIGEALARVEKAGYDVVVCRLEGPDEASFLVRIRKAAPRVSLVAVTPRSNPALEDLARESGADDIQTEAGGTDEGARKEAVRIRRLIARAREARGRSRELRAHTREIVAEYRRLVTRRRIFARHRTEEVTEGLERMTPLLVEDSSDQSILVKRAFEKAALPFPLPVMKDGAQAIDYLSGEGVYADRARHPLPTLVILDIDMPRMSGLQVLAWIRAHPGLARLPVYMLTSSFEKCDQALALGANDFFTKPHSFEALMEVVRTIALRWWFYEQAHAFQSLGR